MKFSFNNPFFQIHLSKYTSAFISFIGKSKKYATFVKEQNTENAFIDNYGIIVVATSDYFEVNYHIVGTSNNEKVPVIKLYDDCPSKKVLHVRYYKDTIHKDEEMIRLKNLKVRKWF